MRKLIPLSMKHQKISFGNQLLSRPPKMYRLQYIRPHHKVKSRLILLPQLLQQIVSMYRLAQSLAQLYLLLANPYPLIPLEQLPHQLKPLLLPHQQFLILPIPTRQHPHLIHPRQIYQMLDQSKMSKMGRIKRTTVYCYLLYHFIEIKVGLQGLIPSSTAWISRGLS